MDLSLAPDKDLRDELFRRCDHGVIVLMREAEYAKDTISVYRSWKGNVHTCVGLAMDLVTMLLRDYEAEHKADGEEWG